MDQNTITLSHDLIVVILAEAVKKGHSLPADAGPETYQAIAMKGLIYMIQSYNKVGNESLS
jgi:hypothetical protein